MTTPSKVHLNALKYDCTSPFASTEDASVNEKVWSFHSNINEACSHCKCLFIIIHYHYFFIFYSKAEDMLMKQKTDTQNKQRQREPCAIISPVKYSDNSAIYIHGQSSHSFKLLSKGIYLFFVCNQYSRVSGTVKVLVIFAITS